MSAPLKPPDAGSELSDKPKPATNWVAQSVRTLFVIDNQVRSLRKRHLIQAYKEGDRDGTYWGIRSDIANYNVSDALDYPEQEARRLANVSTRLAKMGDRLQEELINWGYAICDAAIRRHVSPTSRPPSALPYPNA